MGVFSKLGDALKRVVNKHKIAVSHEHILSYIDSDLEEIDFIFKLFEDNKDVLDHIKKTVILNSSHHNDFAVKMYRMYTSQLKLKAKLAEDRDFLGSFIRILPEMKNDMLTLKGKIDEFIPRDVDSVDMDVFRVSHAAIIGYLEASEVLMSWIAIFHNIIQEEPKFGFHKSYLENNVLAVASFVNALANRKTGETFLIELEALRKSGNNVLLVSENNNSVESYADMMGIYANVNATGTGVLSIVSSVMSFFRPVAFMLWISESIDSVIQWRYDLMKARKKWMEAKMQILRAQMMNTDTNSPEYAKLSEQMSSLSNIIAQYEKKISDAGR